MQKWYERKGFEYYEDAEGEYAGNVWMIKNYKNETKVLYFGANTYEWHYYSKE